MALNTTTRKIDDVMVVYCRGAITFGEETISLRTLVKELLNQSRQIVIELGGVTRIDSGGLGTLVGLYLSARKVGGVIKLANAGRHANEVLEITRLLTLFEVFDKAEDAIPSLAKSVKAS